MPKKYFIIFCSLFIVSCARSQETNHLIYQQTQTIQSLQNELRRIQSPEGRGGSSHSGWNDFQKRIENQFTEIPIQAVVDEDRFVISILSSFLFPSQDLHLQTKSIEFLSFLSDEISKTQHLVYIDSYSFVDISNHERPWEWGALMATEVAESLSIGDPSLKKRLVVSSFLFDNGLFPFGKGEGYINIVFSPEVY